MSKEAKIISVEITESKVFVTAEASVGHNVKAELYRPAGDDSIPLPNDYVALTDIDGSGNYIAIGISVESSNTEKGEKKLFSRNTAGEVKAKIHLKQDKTIQFNDGSDFLCRFNELETSFNSLKNTVNSNNAIFNAHQHVETGGTTATPASPMINSSATVTNVKITKLKAPSFAEDAL